MDNEMYAITTNSELCGIYYTIYTCRYEVKVHYDYQTKKPYINRYKLNNKRKSNDLYFIHDCKKDNKVEYTEKLSEIISDIIILLRNRKEMDSLSEVNTSLSSLFVWEKSNIQLEIDKILISSNSRNILITLNDYYRLFEHNLNASNFIVRYKFERRYIDTKLIDFLKNNTKNKFDKIIYREYDIMDRVKLDVIFNKYRKDKKFWTHRDLQKKDKNEIVIKIGDRCIDGAVDFFDELLIYQNQYFNKGEYTSEEHEKSVTLLFRIGRYYVSNRNFIDIIIEIVEEKSKANTTINNKENGKIRCYIVRTKEMEMEIKLIDNRMRSYTLRKVKININNVVTMSKKGTEKEEEDINNILANKIERYLKYMGILYCYGPFKEEEMAEVFNDELKKYNCSYEIESNAINIERIDDEFSSLLLYLKREMVTPWAICISIHFKEYNHTIKLKEILEYMNICNIKEEIEKYIKNKKKGKEEKNVEDIITPIELKEGDIKEREIENMDTEELCALGVKYEQGTGLERDLHKAIYYFKLAAEKGHAVAEANLGMIYYWGNEKYNVEQDYDEAVKWTRLAAEKGHAVAQNLLGVCYGQGAGVEQSDNKALKWYRLAAEKGEVKAQINLGECYYLGIGVEKDNSETIKWLRKAAKQKDAAAQSRLAWCYATGVGVDANQKQAVALYFEAAKQGDAESQYELGTCYREGKGVIKDTNEMFKWYRLAAEKGVARAQNDLGYCYNVGIGVIQDIVEAYKWYLLASSNATDKIFDMALKNREMLKIELTKEQIEKATKEAREIKEGYNVIVDTSQIERDNAENCGSNKITKAKKEIKVKKYLKIVEDSDIKVAAKRYLRTLYFVFKDNIDGTATKKLDYAFSNHETDIEMREVDDGNHDYKTDETEAFNVFGTWHKRLAKDSADILSKNLRGLTAARIIRNITKDDLIEICNNLKSRNLSKNSTNKK